jgi:hypothetical protein
MQPERLIKDWPFTDMPDPLEVGPNMETPLAQLPLLRPIRVCGRILGVDTEGVRLDRHGYSRARGYFSEPLLLPGSQYQDGTGRLLTGLNITAQVLLSDKGRGGTRGGLLEVFGIEQPCTDQTRAMGRERYVHGVVETNTSTKGGARLMLQMADSVIKLVARDAVLFRNTKPEGLDRLTPGVGSCVRARVDRVMRTDDTIVFGSTGDLYTVA